MLSIVLSLHNLLRWVVLLAALWALIRAYRGWLGGRGWDRRDGLAGRLYSISFDVQFLVGLFTAVLSPLIQAAVGDPSLIGASDGIRFFAAEHIPLILLALAAVHVTSVLGKRAESGRDRHRRSALGYSLSLVLILLATPWWRPLVRGL
jgi:cytochrome c biogenesis factor